MEKEREVYHLGRGPDGKHLYGGWFHFVGRFESTPETQDYQYTNAESGFSFYFSNRPVLVPEVLRDRAVVQVEFTVNVPWGLDEPEPD